jgi:hypothetical protein
MTKTPEELAEEWSAITFDESELPEHEKSKLSDLVTYKAMASLGFLAGYQAAQEHAHAALEEAEAKIQELEDQVADDSKVMNEFDAMLEEKELVDIKLRNAFYRSFNFLICNESIPVFRLNDIRSYVGHLEDVLAARNSPEKPDGSNSSNNSNGWISVKDRLPEINNRMSEDVLMLDEYGEMSVELFEIVNNKIVVDWGEAGTRPLSEFTHWMPLPKPPND